MQDPSRSARRSNGKALPVQLNLDHVAPATRLLEKRRQMMEVQEALDSHKEEYAKREEAFKRREEQLRKKDLELQESLIRFNKFLKENETKRLRAQKKAEEEAKARRDKEQQIEAERKALQAAKLQKAQIEDRLAKNKRYFEFLQKVKDENETEFPEIEFIIDRYKVLSKEQQNLQQKQLKLTAESEQLRNAFQQYTKEQMNLNLGLNNDIARLQKQLEEAEAVTAQLQAGVDAGLKNVSDRTTSISRVMMAVENLELRCRSVVTFLKHYESMHKVEEPGSGNSGSSSSSSSSESGLASPTGAGGSATAAFGITAAARAASAGSDKERLAELEQRKQQTLDRLEVIHAYLRDFVEMCQEYEQYRKEELKNGKLKAAAAAAAAAASGVPTPKAKSSMSRTGVTSSSSAGSGSDISGAIPMFSSSTAQGREMGFLTTEDSHNASRSFSQ